MNKKTKTSLECNENVNERRKVSECHTRAGLPHFMFMCNISVDIRRKCTRRTRSLVNLCIFRCTAVELQKCLMHFIFFSLILFCAPSQPEALFSYSNTFKCKRLSEIQRFIPRAAPSATNYNIHFIIIVSNHRDL